MRAIERLEGVENRLRSTEKEFESARKQAKKAKDDFQAVKDKRFDLFNKAFTHISDQIGPVYKDLTKSATVPMGGQAYVWFRCTLSYCCPLVYLTISSLLVTLTWKIQMNRISMASNITLCLP